MPQTTVHDDEGAPIATPAEIHRWTFTKAAVAQCFIRDVLEMRESGSRGQRLFGIHQMLGS